MKDNISGIFGAADFTPLLFIAYFYQFFTHVSLQRGLPWLPCLKFHLIIPVPYYWHFVSLFSALFVYILSCL